MVVCVFVFVCLFVVFTMGHCAMVRVYPTSKLTKPKIDGSSHFQYQAVSRKQDKSTHPASY